MIAPGMSALQQRPRSNWGAFVAGGLVCALAVAMCQWPARWLAPLVRHLSDGRVHLTETQGTVWQGSAYLALGNGSDRMAPMAWAQRLHWQLSLQGMAGWQLRLRPDTPTKDQAWVWHLHWHPSGWQLALSDIDWSLPTAWLAGLGTPWNTVQPDGVMRVRSQGLQWHPGRADRPTSGELTVTLERFSTRLSSLHPLGDYRLRLHSTGNLKVELSTIQGQLRMTGQGHWHNGRLQFQGEAWADQAQDETALSNLLQVLGPRMGSKTLLKVG